MDSTRNRRDLHSILIIDASDLLMVQFNNKVFKESFDVHSSVNILPVMHIQALANFKELVLLNPILTSTLIKLWLVIFVLERHASEAWSCLATKLDGVGVSFLAHFDELNKKSSTYLRHSLCHVNLSFESVRLREVWKPVAFFKSAYKNHINLRNVHDVERFQIHPYWELASEKHFVPDFLHEFVWFDSFCVRVLLLLLQISLAAVLSMRVVLAPTADAPPWKITQRVRIINWLHELIFKRYLVLDYFLPFQTALIEFLVGVCERRL